MAIVTAIVLVLIVVFAAVAFHFSHESLVEHRYYDIGRWIVIGLLVLVTPLVLYKALQLWLEGEVSPYPDIDRAWKAGIEEFERQGIDLKQVPLFLILGTSGLRQEKALFDAARLELGIREVPAGSAPIHWYASPNGIYLVCSAIGCQSHIAGLGGEVKSGDRSPAAPRRDPSGTLIGTAIGNPGLSGTVIGASPRQAAPVPSFAPSIQGTMIVPTQTMVVGGGGTGAPADPRRIIKLDQGEVNEEERRLSYLARLIRRTRQPLCPINGILNLVPFGVVQRGGEDAATVERATRIDLGVLRRTLQVRCAVTALVAGIEEESGFRELVRRVGRERTLNQGFGKGFSVTNVPLAERLEALAIHSCGAFEDFIYYLFREPDSLNKPGNPKLYSLLCKIRHQVQERLEKILTGGYSCDPDDKPDPDALRFGGCYFGGTGDSEERQAFVYYVVNRLQKQEEELEWTEEALRQDDRFHLASQLVLALDLVLLIALVGEIVYWYWNRTS